MIGPRVFLAAAAAAGALTLAGCDRPGSASTTPTTTSTTSTSATTATTATISTTTTATTSTTTSTPTGAQLDADATLACDEVHWTHEAGQPFPGPALSAEIDRMEHSTKYRPLAEALRSGDVARVFAACQAVEAG